eukprot:TRINITY_DN23668_c0_g1_i1.p1 TRINITY_DN23668_c0_g1~~TRINITY_DN23668_c0_g1_i1.p1  ORF type:complete len:213 (-),score=30.83 TRINITY_DN23668_c0_g1_i1:592-1230(-)
MERTTCQGGSFQQPLLNTDVDSSVSEYKYIRQKAKWGQACGTVFTTGAIVVLAAHLHLNETSLQAPSEPDAVPMQQSEAPVLYLSEASYTVPSACLSAMLLGALASCCCCGVCGDCSDCCGGCCAQFCGTVLGAVGLAKSGVPIWSLGAMWQATLGSQPGGWALFIKGLLFSGFGFLGGVTLTGSAAAAGMYFCQRYNIACEGCVGALPHSS